jgi:hypothetical protein
VTKSTQVEYRGAVPNGSQLHQPRVVSCGSEIGRFSEIAGRAILLRAKFYNSFQSFWKEMEFMQSELRQIACSGRQCRRKLRLTAFRLLLACMPAKKPSISLSPRSLEAGAPELGTADLTEVRKVPRPFPKDAGERNCYRYLLGQMQATPDHPHETKAEFENTCRRRFQVTAGSFDYCWREAIKVSGARWDQPGRPRRKRPSR